MDTTFLLTIIGTLASFLGAFISVRQARRSREAADEAIRARAQMVGQRETSELAQLHVKCKNVQKDMGKYGPASPPEQLQGVNFEKDGQRVQDFILDINENSGLFEGNNPNKVHVFCELMRPLLEQFSSARTPKKRKEHGNEILLQLNSMNAILKQRLDTNREKVH